MTPERSFALLWCRLYSAATPPDVRDRRREEYAAHAIEYFGAYGRSWHVRARFLLACLRGIRHDLAWCHQERVAREMSGLPAHVLFGPSGSLVVAGFAITSAYVLSWLPMSPWVGRFEASATALAAACVVCSLAWRIRTARARRTDT